MSSLLYYYSAGLPPQSYLLLEDGVSFFLLEDGVSKLILG